MAILIQVTVTNDDTGEVEKTYMEAVDTGRSHPFEVASAIKRLFGRIFKTVFGEDNDDWY